MLVRCLSYLSVPSTTMKTSASLAFKRPDGGGESDRCLFVAETLDLSLVLLYCSCEALLHVLGRKPAPDTSGSLEVRLNLDASGHRKFESDNASVITFAMKRNLTKQLQQFQT